MESTWSRTITNAVEWWHNAWQSTFRCHHPTVWTFLQDLQKNMPQHKLHLSEGHPALFTDRIANSVSWMIALYVLLLHLEYLKYWFIYVLLLIFRIHNVISSIRQYTFLILFGGGHSAPYDNGLWKLLIKIFYKLFLFESRDGNLYSVQIQNAFNWRRQTITRLMSSRLYIVILLKWLVFQWGATNLSINPRRCQNNCYKKVQNGGSVAF